jgi:hypothetical protein
LNALELELRHLVSFNINFFKPIWPLIDAHAACC